MVSSYWHHYPSHNPRWFLSRNILRRARWMKRRHEFPVAPEISVSVLSRLLSPTRRSTFRCQKSYTLTFGSSWPSLSIYGSLLSSSFPREPPPGRWISSFFANNTLCWMVNTSRSRRSIVHRLDHAYTALLTFTSPSSFLIIFVHISGVNNNGAYTLSRPHKYPTWSSAIAEEPTLAGLIPYWLPHTLLSTVLSIVLTTPIVVPLEHQMNKLLLLELNTLPTG